MKVDKNFFIFAALDSEALQPVKEKGADNSLYFIMSNKRTWIRR